MGNMNDAITKMTEAFVKCGYDLHLCNVTSCCSSGD